MVSEDFKVQLSKALRKLKISKPLIYDEDSGSLRRSHRYMGMYTTEGDREGYRHVYCYMERGMQEHVDLTAIVLLEVIRFQVQEGYSRSIIFLSSFGGLDHDLVHNPEVLSIDYITNSLPIARRLCKLAGTEPISGGEGAVLKSLFPAVRINYTNIGPPNADDLLVFFCYNRPIFMEKALRARYMARLKKHSLWVSIDLNQITVEVGKIPEEWNKPEISAIF